MNSAERRHSVGSQVCTHVESESFCIPRPKKKFSTNQRRVRVSTLKTLLLLRRRAITFPIALVGPDAFAIVIVFHLCVNV